MSKALHLEDENDQTDLEVSNTYIPDLSWKKKIFRSKSKLLTEKKTGWIQGVFLSCLLGVCSVTLFLRLPWMVAQAGIALSLVIIAMSAAVCIITTLSMSAIFTNGIVETGGVYYTISRNLGPEFGGSVGIIFSFANILSITMNTIGFCDSLVDLCETYNIAVNIDSYYVVWIVGSIVIALTTLVVTAGSDIEQKIQNILLSIIIVSILFFVICTIVGPVKDKQIAQGFIGLNERVFLSNSLPNFRDHSNEKHNWITVFAVFFPAATGMHVGANVANELKDPATAIPKGSLLAIIVSMCIYAVVVILCGASALKDASGNVADIAYLPDGSLDLDRISACKDSAPGCIYGLHNDFHMLHLLTLFSPIIYLGCWAATLSTVLTNMTAVPKCMQAMGKDRIYPGLSYFAKPYGKNKTPLRGHLLTTFIAILFFLIEDINHISPLITNFFLAAYALMNFCTFHAALVRPLGWRPTFEYYNIWLSLLGCVLCVLMMVVISWLMFLITITIFVVLYLVVQYRRPAVNWGSTTQAQVYKNALSSVYTLARTDEHVKNYWPQLLVLTGRPHRRPIICELAHLITQGGSLMICGTVIEKHISHNERQELMQEGDEWLRQHKIKALCALVSGFKYGEGVHALVEASGVGRLCPNVLMLGFKELWQDCTHDILIEYFEVVHMAFESGLAVAVLRVEGGMSWGFDSSPPIERIESRKTRVTFSKSRSKNNINEDSNISMDNLQTKSSAERERNWPNEQRIDRNKQRLAHLMMFHSEGIGLGYIDVWWLYDDGGLTMLIPYIVSARSTWSHTKLRIFSLCNQPENVANERKSMATLLNKFRISYSALTIIDDIWEEPQPETYDMFNKLIEKFMDIDNPECQITDEQLRLLEDRTRRQLRLRELLLKHSISARFIVMSLPMPRKGIISPPLYTAWLEMLSRGLPPMLFVRGNGVSVLTYYS